MLFLVLATVHGQCRLPQQPFRIASRLAHGQANA